ncbi:hypothetical protein ES754_08800 [Psychrobacter frigidicola]|uniref:Lipoprotein n=1 Tax=Psychrobacter frigidicola TaxID=45611 RepID=A0A5C7A3I1_9GAMM|nr:hypothetical protein [Psychrobacter frigidicola]TXD97097.1 hypothetical protein ES754_08800 [Psychrobacter frigidicola]
MAKRLISMLIMSAASMWILTGCDSGGDKADKTAAGAEQTTAAPSTESATVIDWSLIASDEKAAARADYQYPFALDSQNVRDYADYFKVDNATAQHNLTVSMASNEALSKVLDQLGNSYTSHELTDDDNMTLIIHTLPDIATSRYDYVFAEDFAKGLVLPINIQPNGKKSDVQGHGEVQE